MATRRSKGNVSDVRAVLTERAKVHGSFASHSATAQALKDVARSALGWNRLDADMRESIDMQFHKIARAVNGDPRHKDHWIDMAGYPTLVADRLEAEDGKA